MKRVLFGVVAVLALSAGSAWAGLSNGSFETGDVSGWSVYDTGGTVAAITSHSQYDGGTGPATWIATDGTYYGILAAGSADTPIKLWQSFSAPAGSALEFDYYWDTTETSTTTFNDYGKAVLSWGAAAPVTLFYADVATYGAYNGIDWTPIHYYLPDTTTYTLTFSVVNVGDANLLSWVGVDKVQVVPIPAAVFLGMLGLSAAGLGLRKLS